MVKYLKYLALIISISISSLSLAASPVVDWGGGTDGGGSSSNAYARYVPTTGTTITLPPSVTRVLLEPAATIATLTIIFPPTPTDGYVFELMSTQQIATLTMTAGSKTVRGSGFTLNPDSGAAWIYRTANTTWYVRY